VFTDWDRLDSLPRIEPGQHTFTLIVDSTDLVAETDESDNTFQTGVIVVAAPDPQIPPPIPNRLPGLAPVAPPGWPAPIIASAYSGAKLQRPLSMNELSYIRHALENQGLASTPDNVHTKLYYDGKLVSKEFRSGAIMDNQVTRSEWAGLSEVVRLTPGEHTLKLLVDPRNLIDESDETNNSYEVTFMWGGGEVPVLQLPRASPPPDLPDPPLLPNLVPCLRFGSDGASIASNRQDTFKDSQPIVSDPVYIDVVVRNESSVDLASCYEVLLFFDDQLVETLGAKNGTPAGSIQWSPDWDGLTGEVELEAGVHSLKIEIGPLNRVTELDETDNVYVKEFEWLGEKTPPEPLVSYSDDDARLRSLPSLIENVRGIAKSRLVERLTRI